MTVERGSVFRPHPRRYCVDSALVTWANGVKGKPHVWGSCDCLSLVIDAVRVQVGEFPTVDEYHDAAGALRVFKESLTHGSIGDWFVARGLLPLGFARFAHSGAVIVWEPTEADPLPHFGVLIGRDVFQCTAELGVHALPWHLLATDEVARAYGVI